MRTIYIWLTLLFLGCVSGFGQTAEETYLQQENDRIARANANEQKIELFITRNLAKYNLTPEKLNQVSKEITEDDNARPLSGTALQLAIDEAKREELRKLYFKQNPDSASDYQATAMPNFIDCVNGGFENGNTAGYSFFYNQYININQPNPNWVIYNNFPQTVYTPTTATPKITLINNTVPSPDPVTGLPRTNTGNYSIRLNDNGGNTDVSRMTKSFTVTQNSISFSFALVLENGGHLNANPPHNPYFQYRLLHGSQVIVDYRVTANPNTAIFHPLPTNANILYTDWICENIDVSDYLNQDVTLEFIVSDCGQTAHKGYVYLDDFCGTACTAPALGNVILDSVNQNCPTYPLVVTGTFTPPTNNTLTTLSLDVINSVGIVVATLTNPIISGNTFSFNVNQVDFFGAGTPGPGDFEFRATAVFTLNSSTFTTTLFDLSANQNADVSFNDCVICCASCCPDNQGITETVLFNFYDTRQAKLTIQATNIINSGGHGFYHAGNSITFRNGFNAKAGSTLHGYIEGCSGTYQGRAYTAPKKSSGITAAMDEAALVLSNDRNIITISPNPNNGIFKIKLNTISEGEIEITDMIGLTVFKKSFTKQDEFEVNMQERPKGIYIVRVVSNNTIVSEKIIKN